MPRGDTTGVQIGFPIAPLGLTQLPRLIPRGVPKAEQRLRQRQLGVKRNASTVDRYRVKKAKKE